MEPFWKASAGILIAVILGLVIGKKELSLVLTMTACCLVFGITFSYLQPVIALLKDLEAGMGGMDGMLEVLLQCAGAVLLTELVNSICQDSGNGALGKSIQILGSAVILYLSIPAFRNVLELIREILGGAG